MRPLRAPRSAPALATAAGHRCAAPAARRMLAPAATPAPAPSVCVLPVSLAPPPSRPLAPPSPPPPAFGASPPSPPSPAARRRALVRTSPPPAFVPSPPSPPSPAARRRAPPRARTASAAGDCIICNKLTRLCCLYVYACACQCESSYSLQPSRHTLCMRPFPRHYDGFLRTLVMSIVRLWNRCRLTSVTSP